MMAIEANPDHHRHQMSSIVTSGVVISCEEDVTHQSRVVADNSQTLGGSKSSPKPKRNTKERFKYEDEIDVVGFDFAAQEII